MYKNEFKMETNISPQTIKLLEENTGKTLFDISHSNIFWALSPKAKDTKAKTNEWDLIKLKSFRIPKESYEKMKKQSSEWEKY